MNKICNLVRKKSTGKEVKEMRRLIAIATILLFTFGTAMPAGAFTSDVKRILYAEADLETDIPDLKTMPMPHLMDKTTGADLGAVSADNPIEWTYESSKTWKVADQYIKIAYQANLPGWGVQVYSDNTSDSANPKWIEQPADPNNTRVDRPAGLVGVNATYIAVPVAWKAFPGGDYELPQYSDGSGFDEDTEYRTNYTEPKEQAVGNPATDDYYIELYQYKKTATGDLYGKYCWLVDEGSQKWVDKDDDGVVDPGEIVSDYSDGADVNTVVNYLGSSTCTYDSTGTFIYRDACTSPVYIVLAAKIATATIKSVYKTNTLTLELYHE